MLPMPVSGEFPPGNATSPSRLPVEAPPISFSLDWSSRKQELRVQHVLDWSDRERGMSLLKCFLTAVNLQGLLQLALAGIYTKNYSDSVILVFHCIQDCHRNIVT